MKTPSFAHEIFRICPLAGVGRNNICEYLLFEMALGRHENTKFCKRFSNWRICPLAGVGRNNICAYLLFEMALGRHENHQVLHTNLENLHWQGWAGIIYVHIFYLKWLWEGMQTTKFCTRNWRICTPGRGGQEIIYVNLFYLKWLREGMQTPSFAHDIGSCPRAGVGSADICEYLFQIENIHRCYS